jgi:hypothetical protein
LTCLVLADGEDDRLPIEVLQSLQFPTAVKVVHVGGILDELRADAKLNGRCACRVGRVFVLDTMLARRAGYLRRDGDGFREVLLTDHVVCSTEGIGS